MPHGRVMIWSKLKWADSLRVWSRTRPRLMLVLLLSVAGFAASLSTVGIIRGRNVANRIYLNRDLSAGDLSQWTHRDYGLGTDKGGNESGAGYLWYHSNIAGRRAAGLTVTPTAHASPAASSDSVYLWERAQFWNYAPHEMWLRTSVMFPSTATISAGGTAGEQSFQPTTGEWNWFLELHNDSCPLPSCAKEFANVALTVRTHDPPEIGIAGARNARMALRVRGGNDCAPNIVWVDGPPLQWDHWYEMLLRIKCDPSRGIFVWYLDNFRTPSYSNLKIPTLYTRPAGYVNPSYTSLALTNYRWHAPWDSTIYLGPLLVGSTQTSVLKFSEQILLNALSY